MTIQEVSIRYGIPMKVLRQYESWGGCSLPEEGTEPRQYDDSDLERLGTMMTLYGVALRPRRWRPICGCWERGPAPAPSAWRC